MVCSTRPLSPIPLAAIYPARWHLSRSLASIPHPCIYPALSQESVQWSSDEAEEEEAPQCEAELWLRFAKSLRTRAELRGFLSSMGLSVRGVRAELETRLAEALMGHSTYCSRTQETLRSLVAALPLNQRGVAAAALNLHPVSIPCPRT